MRGGGGLPYEECRRQQKHAAPRDRTRDWPAYALPPFHHGPAGSAADASDAGRGPAPHARRPRRVDGAAVSGVLVALCVAALLAATVAVAGR